MSNTNGVPDIASEIQALMGHVQAPCILSTTWPIVPVTSLTLAAFATHGFVKSGAQLVYVNQAAMPVTLSGADGAFWVALHRDTSTAVASWTRQPGTHYLWRSNPTKPAEPAGGLILTSVTVAGGIITAVSQATTPTTPLSLQDGKTIAFTGGTITGLTVLSSADVSFQAGELTNLTRVGIGTPATPEPLTVIGGATIDTLGINALPTPPFALAVNNSIYSTSVVSIATTDALFNLTVNGTAAKPGGGSWADTSSQRFKKNVRSIPGALALLLSLTGRRFQWDETEHIRVLGPGDHLGFVIEEVENVMPSWVHTTLDGEKALTIRGFEALAVEAIRTLRVQMVQLEQRVSALEAAQP